MVKIYTNSSYGSICLKGIYLIIIATFFITLSGWNPVSAQQVQEIDNYISVTAAADRLKATRLQSLVNDVHPAVYINEGKFTPIGEAPLVAQIDAGAVNKLQEGHPSLATVSLLLIRFSNKEELQAFKLLPATVRGMTNLEYIVLSLGFDAAQRENFSGIQGFEASRIVFLYESARPF